MNDLNMVLGTREELRDKGIKKAVDHAEAVTPDWAKLAMVVLKAFLMNNKGKFQCEDVRRFANEYSSLPVPPHARAWGGVIQKAARDKLIVNVGTTNSLDPKCHKSIVSLWVAN